jgi:N utilization substance protein B
MAVGEMLMNDAPPKAVILDEAVELAKIYSTDGSPSFVNGVLSSIAEQLLP